MKTILNSIVAGSLLATLAVAQPLHSARVDNGAHGFGQTEVQPASSNTDPLGSYRRRARGYCSGHRAGGNSASANRSLLVYVITAPPVGGPEFGVVDYVVANFCRSVLVRRPMWDSG
jgi:hypothetical protein